MLKKTFGSIVGQLMLALLGMAFIATASAPSTAESEAHDPLSESQWVMHSLDDNPLLSPYLPTLKFSEQRLSGHTSCGHLLGQYIVANDGTLALDQLNRYQREADCAEPQQAIEKILLDRLRQVRIYAISRSNIHLMDGNRNTLLKLSPYREKP